MTNDEAVKILGLCKPLALRATNAFPKGLPINFNLTQQDLVTLQDFMRVQIDPVTAGPGLLKKLFAQADLTLVDVYKLDQLNRLVFKRRNQGRNVVDGAARSV